PGHCSGIQWRGVVSVCGYVRKVCTTTNCFLCTASYSCTRGDTLQTSPIPTVTPIAVHINGHMSQFPCSIACTSEDVAIQNGISSNAGTNCQIHIVFASSSSSKDIFPQTCCISVIF